MPKRFLSSRIVQAHGLEKVEHAVVQIVAHAAYFNWRDPYRVRTQAEVLATGFFIDTEGHLFTNAHVVDQAKLIEVHVPALGRIALRAHVVSFCPENDIALLKLQDEDIERIRQHLGQIDYLELGDSDAVVRTEPILALGYPLGQYNLKGSTGIVSGFENIEGNSLIQITAPINPGNSGGPLLNENGQVIGITLAIAAAASNIGYALPINVIKVLLPELFKNKFVRVPVLGILYSYTSDDEARYLGNPLPSGLYVNLVGDNTLAARMGIKEGDMIYELNGYKIDSFAQAVVPWTSERIAFRDLLSRIAVGSALKIKLYRQGKLLELPGKFELVDEYPVRAMYPDYEEIDYEIVAGMVIMQLTDNHIELLVDQIPSLMEYILLENKTKPVLILAHILEGSHAGLRESLIAGDTIESINGKKVETLDELRHALSLSKKTGFLTVTTRMHIFAAFPVEQVLKEDEFLSKEFMYPQTKGLKNYIK